MLMCSCFRCRCEIFKIFWLAYRIPKSGWTTRKNNITQISGDAVMADFQDLSAFENFLNCPICFDPFDQPKVLQCGHTFCLRCLEQLSRSQDKYVSCPECRERTKKPTEGVSKLRNDFRITQIKDLLLETSVNHAETKPVEEPQENDECAKCHMLPALVGCLQCQTKLCGMCHKGHYLQAGGVECHTILKLQAIPKCNVHGNMCTHACYCCKGFICKECLTGGCKEHEPTEIGQAIKQDIESGKLHRLRESAENIVTKFDENSSKINKKAAAVADEIETLTDALLRCISTESNQLRNEVLNTKNDAIERMTISYCSAQELQTKLAPLSNITSDELRKGIPASLLHMLWLDPGTVCEPNELASTAYNFRTLQFKSNVSPDKIRLGNVISPKKTNHPPRDVPIGTLILWLFVFVIIILACAMAKRRRFWWSLFTPPLISEFIGRQCD